ALNRLRAEEAFHRADKRDVGRTRPVGDDEPGLAARGSDEAAAALLRMTIDETLAGLPEGHRALIEYRIEGHEVAEIAELTGRSKRSVERILQDFRRRLRTQLELEPREGSDTASAAPG